MKKLIILIGILLINFGCKEEEKPMVFCGVENPAENLSWLKAITEELNESYLGPFFYVTSGTYQDQQVFLVENCCPDCNTVTLVYACGGENIGILGFDGAGIEPSEVKDQVIVWRGEGNLCTT